MAGTPIIQPFYTPYMPLSLTFIETLLFSSTLMQTLHITEVSSPSQPLSSFFFLSNTQHDSPYHPLPLPPPPHPQHRDSNRNLRPSRLHPRPRLHRSPHQPTNRRHPHKHLLLLRPHNPRRQRIPYSPSFLSPLPHLPCVPPATNQSTKDHYQTDYYSHHLYETLIISQTCLRGADCSPCHERPTRREQTTCDFANNRDCTAGVGRKDCLAEGANSSLLVGRNQRRWEGRWFRLSWAGFWRGRVSSVVSIPEGEGEMWFAKGQGEE